MSLILSIHSLINLYILQVFHAIILLVWYSNFSKSSFFAQHIASFISNIPSHALEFSNNYLICSHVQYVYSNMHICITLDRYNLDLFMISYLSKQ